MALSIYPVTISYLFLPDFHFLHNKNWGYDHSQRVILAMWLPRNQAVQGHFSCCFSNTDASDGRRNRSSEGVRDCFRLHGLSNLVRFPHNLKYVLHSHRILTPLFNILVCLVHFLWVVIRVLIVNEIQVHVLKTLQSSHILPHNGAHYLEVSVLYGWQMVTILPGSIVSERVCRRALF